MSLKEKLSELMPFLAHSALCNVTSDVFPHRWREADAKHCDCGLAVLLSALAGAEEPPTLPEPPTDSMCGATDEDLFCTKPKGHKGDHVARIGAYGHFLHSWPIAEPAAAEPERPQGTDTP